MRMTASWFGSLDPPNTRLWRDRSAPERGLPSDRHLASPTASRVPSCSELSRQALRVVAEEATNLDSSCARQLAAWRVGTKKRAFRSNKETDEGKKMRRSAETS